MRQIPSLLLAGCLWSVVACPAGWAQDTDRDGIPDAVEEQLGTDKQMAQSLETIGTYPAQHENQPELDIVRVDFGNVAKDRWLWSIHFAQSYTFSNSLLIIYLDADHDDRTGRKDMGCEVMLSHRLGTASVTGFASDGSDCPAPCRAWLLSTACCTSVTMARSTRRTAARCSVSPCSRKPSSRTSVWTARAGRRCAVRRTQTDKKS